MAKMENASYVLHNEEGGMLGNISGRFSLRFRLESLSRLRPHIKTSPQQTTNTHNSPKEKSTGN